MYNAIISSSSNYGPTGKKQVWKKKKKPIEKTKQQQQQTNKQDDVVNSYFCGKNESINETRKVIILLL